MPMFSHGECSAISVDKRMAYAATDDLLNREFMVDNHEFSWFGCWENHEFVAILIHHLSRILRVL